MILVYPDGSEIQTVTKPDKVDHPYSRYRSLWRLTTTQNQTFIETNYITTIPTSTTDKFHFVEPGETNRLDIIAYTYYKLPQLWWVIAMANNITNTLSVTSGTKLRIPSMNTLFQFGGILA